MRTTRKNVNPFPKRRPHNSSFLCPPSKRTCPKISSSQNGSMPLQTWKKFRSKAFRCTSVQEMTAKAAEGTKLKRVLGFFDLVMFGMGSMIGVGVFVLTGDVSRDETGPAVILSYALAGIVALFMALVYAEFAADVPISGAAYNYVDLVFGEFASWIVASSLLMGTVLSVGAIARGFTGYFSTLLGISSDALIVNFPGWDIEMDIAGALVVVFLALLLACGVRESFTFNSIATALCIAVILFTIGAAIPNIDTDNFTPFFPEEFRGDSAFRGASIVFYAYLGFDSIANVAEESSNPSRDVPLGIITSLSICTLLYGLMAGALIGMVPYNEVDIMAPYSVAFKMHGWEWADRVVSLGALCAMVTSIFSSVCTLCRLIMVLAREGFLPKFLATVHERTSTPVNATLVVSGIGAVMTLFFDINTLSSMVSLSVFCIFSIVCAASVWRRYVKTEGMIYEADIKPTHPGWVALRLALVLIISIIEGLSVEKGWPTEVWLFSIGCFLMVVCSFHRLPIVNKAFTFSLSLQPLISCLGLLSCVHLTVTLGTDAYLRFLIWLCISISSYLLYSVHHTKEEEKPYESVQPNSEAHPDQPTTV